MLQFLLLTEGSSDRNLRKYLEELMINLGADKVRCEAPDLSLLPQHIGHSVKSKVDAAVKLFPQIDLIIIHRDADNAGLNNRRLEIINQTSHLPGKKIVPLVIDKMLESWLLLEADSICQIVNNSTAVSKLKKFNPTKVHSISNPKDELKKLLAQASGLSGQRLNELNKDFPRYRARLIQNLEPGALLESTLAFGPFLSDVQQSIH